VFQAYLTQIQAGGDNALADTLVSLYKTDPDTARCIGYLQKVHPALADLLVSQPWFQDGLNDSERAFIDYGLGGETTQGIAGATGIDDVLSNIIVNQQWVVDTVQLSGGVKFIVAPYDTPGDVSRENATTIVNIIKAAAPIIEKFNGAKYPLDAITVFPNYVISPGQSASANGIIDLGLDSEGVNQSCAYGILHELTHVMVDSRKENYVIPTEWINEGFADFGAAYAAEVLSDSNLPWWDSSWTFTVQEDYDADLSYREKMGLSNVPLSSSTFDSESHNVKVFVGELFMIDLYQALGGDLSGDIGGGNYTNMMSALYDWHTANPTAVLDATTLQNFALNSSPNDTVKANVQNLFNTMVWGTSQ
jgi:hypothetical protein